MKANYSFLLAFTLFFVGGVNAATYSLPHNLPSACSASGAVVTCNGLSLAWDDVITVSGSSPITLNINGNADLNNAKINLGGDANKLTINVTGNLTSNTSVKVEANINAHSVTLGSSNTIHGDITATNTITTGSGTLLTGDITAPTVTLGSANTLNGKINADFITISSTNSVVNGELYANNTIDLKSGTSVTGNMFAGGNITTASPVTLIGDINADGDFILASGSTVLGNINTNSITMAPAGSVITGELSAINDVVLGSGNTVVGDVYGKTITLKSSTGRIEGNATASEQVTINWHGTITGDVTASHIQNNGGTIGGDIYCDTRVGLIRECLSSSNNGGNTPTNPTGILSCDGFNDMLTAGGGIIGDGKFSYNDGATINGNPIRGSNGNSPTPDGNVDFIETTFSGLKPFPFPGNSNFGGASSTNGQAITPGSYHIVKTNDNASASTSGGGVYYINELNIGAGSTIIFGSGDYFIKKTRIRDNAKIIIANSARVRFFISNQFFVNDSVDINKDGDAAGLIVYLYANAKLRMDKYNHFRGAIYTPYPNTDIEFDKDSIIEGAIISAGKVAINKDVKITFDTELQQEVSDGIGCSAQPTLVHHYRILHPQEVISCMAAPITIQACANESCSAFYQDIASLALHSSHNQSEWNASTTNTTSINVANGQTTLGLSLVPGGPTTLAITAATPATTDPNLCFDPTGTQPSSCQINFKTAGLLVDTVPDAPYAGKEFDLILRAIETNTTTGACQARVQGAKEVSFTPQCQNPSTCMPGQEFTLAQVSGGNSTVIHLNNNGTTTQVTPLTVLFDANGTATLAANYTDVGLLQLGAELFLPPTPQQGEPNITDPAVALSGEGVFVVRPHTLIAQAFNNDGTAWTATEGIGAGFKAAGEAFTLAIQSLNAQGNPTPNFGREAPIAQGTVAYHSMLFPTDGFGSSANLIINGSFIPTPNISGALVNQNVVWNEAGTVNLTAALHGNSYLNAGDAFRRPSNPVGRFYPHHYLVDYSQVSNSCQHYTYMNEPNIKLDFTVSAVNKSGQLVENYGHNNYIGSAAISAGVQAIDTSETTDFTDRFDALLNQAWEKGLFSVTITNAIFKRLATNQPDGPFDLNVYLTLTNTEDNRGFTSPPSTSPTIKLAGDLHLRYGRMLLENIYGPENLPLNIILGTEYWTGTHFAKNTFDDCTPFTPDDLEVLDDPALLDPSAEKSVASGDKLVAGQVPPGDLYWRLPLNGGTSQGEFEFEYKAPPWLQFDWGAGSNENPRATAGFGQYRGKDKIIFSLERYL